MLFLSQAEVSEIICEVLPPEIVEKIYKHYVNDTFRKIQQEPHFLARLFKVVPHFTTLRKTTSIVSLKSINMSHSSGQADIEKALMSLHNNNCFRYNKSVIDLKRHLGRICGYIEYILRPEDYQKIYQDIFLRRTYLHEAVHYYRYHQQLFQLSLSIPRLAVFQKD